MLNLSIHKIQKSFTETIHYIYCPDIVRSLFLTTDKMNEVQAQTKRKFCLTNTGYTSVILV